MWLAKRLAYSIQKKEYFINMMKYSFFLFLAISYFHLLLFTFKLLIHKPKKVSMPLSISSSYPKR